MSEFWKRTLSGAIYITVIIGSIVWHPYVFCGLSAALAMLGVREYNRLSHPRCAMDVGNELCALLLPFCFVFSELQICFICYAIMLMTLLVAELWDKKGNPISAWGHIVGTQAMIALPFALMNALYGYSKYLLLGVFVLIWVNDSMAYCVGVLTAKLPKGNHKMFPRVSPKKSWEGLFGGFVFAVGAGLLMAHFNWFEAMHSHIHPYLFGALFALIVALFGTLGDLMESVMKRTIGVKDSGRFLPGHGGVLDRFDSILLAVPAVLLLLLIIQSC